MDKSKQLLKKQETAALQEFKRRISGKYGNLVSSVLLYGSKARGQAGKDSDIDVLVVLNSEERDIKKDISSIAFDIIIEYSVDLSVMIITSVRWNMDPKNPTSFIYNVKKDSVKL